MTTTTTSYNLLRVKSEYQLFLKFCEDGNLSEAELMLRQGKICLDFENLKERLGLNYIHNPLLVAVNGNRLEIVKLLLRYGAKLDKLSKSSTGTTPLFITCLRGQLEMARLLLDNGADVNYANSSFCGASPIFYAIIYNHFDLVRLLFERGAQVTHDQFCHIFLYACEREDRELVRFFLEREVDLVEIFFGDRYYAQGELLSAIRDGKTAMVRMLVEHGACEDLANLKSKDGWDIPLQEACGRVTDPKIVEILLEAGADPGGDIGGRNPFGQTALHSAAWRFDCRTSIITILELLLKHGAEIDAQDLHGNTALHLCQSERVMTFLLSRGIRTDLRNKEGKGVAETLELDMPQVFERHMSELGRMKSTKLNGYGLSLHDLMLMNRHQLWRYLKNVRLKEVMESCGFAEEYPIYGAILRERLAQGEKRKRLMDSAVERLKHLTNTHLPYHCYATIFKYLSDEEISRKIFSV